MGVSLFYFPFYEKRKRVALILGAGVALTLPKTVSPLIFRLDLFGWAKNASVGQLMQPERKVICARRL